MSMQNPDADIMEVSDAVKPALYKSYTTWQTLIKLFTMIFCIVFVAGITYAIADTGEKKFIWFYLLPAACYIFS
jgi:hypothetical protein